MTYRGVGVWACGFLAGSAVGWVAGVLTAPQSGARTRRMIQRKAGETQDRITGAADEVLDRGREVIDHGRRFVDEAVHEMKTAVSR